MPESPSPLIWDGFTTQAEGMNDGLAGSLLPPSQLALLVNGTVRGNYIRQRPGHRRIMQVFGDAVGFFQHGSWLRCRNGTVFLVAVRAGRFYRVDPIAKSVSEFTITGDPNPSTLCQGWSVPGGAEGFWIYNDGQTSPLIWTGGNARRAGKREIKPGTVIAYVQGRLWYSLPNGLAFRATDLVNSRDSGSWVYDFKDSILKETENTFLNEGGDFAVPAESGGIRAMVATAVLDTSQGQGPLQVFCVNCAFSVNTPVDRDIWKAVKYPIQTQSLIGGVGMLGAQSTRNVNSDIFGRASDGLRSFIVARRYFRDWGNTPQSFEVSNILKYDQPDLLGFGSAALLDNRFLMTISPVWSSAGVYHRGLAVMNLAPISSILSQGKPCYDGIWTGLNILSIQQTDIGTYAFVLTANGTVDLWEIGTGGLFDDDTGRIQWNIVPRTLFTERDAAGRPEWRLKKLETGDLFYDELGGRVNFSLSWKPDGYPCWIPWQSWEECAPICSTTPGCKPGKQKHTQYRPRFRLRTPDETCAVGAKGLPVRCGYEHTIKLDITGPARLRGARIGAIPQGEPRYAPNCTSPECVPIECCDFDYFIYAARGTDGPATPSGSGSSGGSGSGGGTTDGGGGDGTGGSIGGDEGTDVEDNPGEGPPPEYPNLPPHERLPQFPNPPPLGPGCFTFDALWTAPPPESVYGNEHRIGRSAEIPLGLQDGVLEQWADDVWEKFNDYVIANGITVTACQIETSYQAGSERRYDANLWYVDEAYFSTVGLDWVLTISYCTT